MKHATSAFTISAYEFFQKFPNEQTAIEYIESRRWKNGVICPHCQDSRVSQQRDKKSYQCKACRNKFTVRTGTIFERSHIPLHKWLYASYLLQTARKGVSSLQLSKELGIRQSSAWFLLHRLRESCGPEGAKLKGVVEVDETYIGGKEGNKHAKKQRRSGRGPVGKQAVVGLRERGGRTKAVPVDATDQATLHGLIAQHVEQDAQIYTDDHRGYLGISQKHGTVKHSAKEYVNGMAHTNGIESVWALLKRGYNGTYHNWSMKHTIRYVNEFLFRLNDGNVKNHTMQRVDSLLDGAIRKRLTYASLIQ